jgi:hypothetical protein
MGVGGQPHAPAALLAWKRCGTPYMEGWMGPTAVCIGVEYLAPTGIRSLVVSRTGQ